MKASPPGLELGVFPITRGFGWIAFEGPFSAFDWGTVFVQTDKNRKCLVKFEKLLRRLQPETLVMEAEPPKGSGSQRLQRLRSAMAVTAAGQGIEVAIYGRSDVQASFATIGARTRYDVAQAVARQLPALQHRLPRTRRAWMAEDRRMALFNAAALVMTHHHMGANEFFERLLDAA